MVAGGAVNDRLINADAAGIRRSGLGYGMEDSHDAISMLKRISCLNFFPKRIGIAVHFTQVRDTKMVERHLVWS
jgi:hypothetical protein